MKDSACFIGHRKISDTPRCSRFGARSSRFVIAKPCNGCGNPFSLKGRRILSRYALRMTSRLLIFGFIFVTFVTARAYFAFMRMVYCIAANAACVFKVRAIPVYMVNGTLFGKIANGAFAQRNSLV